MKILNIKSLGMRRTYSPEMRSERHNYITDRSGAVHANSHSVAYCSIAYRNLWLKAVYPAEYWAAVMSDCHPLKLARYMGVARTEGVKFAPMDVTNLTVGFTVTGDVINPGLIGLKKVGDTAAAQFAGTGQYDSFDQFVDTHPKSKLVLERLVKLGSFDHFNPNRKALWTWYLYRYGSGSGITALRQEIRQRLLLQQGWTAHAIEQERERQLREFRANYPKRSKIPPAILRWQPKPGDDYEAVTALLADDYYTDHELLEFEREFLGYYLSNPLQRYQFNPRSTLQRVREQQRGVAHAVVVGVEFGSTKKGKEMCRVALSDGDSEGLVLIWEEDCVRFRPLLERAAAALQREIKSEGKKRVELGVGASLAWDQQRKTFTLQHVYRKGRATGLWLLEDKIETTRHQLEEAVNAFA